MRYRLISLVMLSAACSDGPDPFEFGEQFPPGTDDSVRLTYSINDDRTPAWSLGADSVYYGGGTYPPHPANQNLLFVTPRAGGIAQPIFATSVFGRPVHVAPALAPAGESIAFFEITRLWRYDCAAIVNAQFPEAPPPSPSDLPLLQEAVLRVRPLDRHATDAAVLPVTFGGRDLDTTRHPFNRPGVIVIEGAPFQRIYSSDRTPLFRASWSPDGQRVVVSDGKQLLLWTVGSAAAQPIANTADGVWPAWSPDGQWIAFTRLTRGEAERTQYNCLNMQGAVVDVYDVTTYELPLNAVALGDIALIRPDGTDIRTLGAGEAPSWLASSNELVFARGNQLWRSNIDGTAATPIAGTANGHEPAVSPDGARIAFTKPGSPNQRDVWVVRF